MKKTKIICTIGPASSTMEVLRKMMENGMDVARFNLSHASHSFCHEVIEKIRRLEQEYHKTIGILFDTNGPELRLGSMEGGAVFLKLDQMVRVYGEDCAGTEEQISIHYPNLVDDVRVGTELLLSDGKVILMVEGKEKDALYCRVVQEGFIYSHRSVHIPTIRFSMDYLSEKDREDIRFAVEEKIDFLALSFLRSHFDVLDVTDYLIQLGDDHIELISKIENADAIDDLDEILRDSDGVMVARGDLGVEIPMEKLPGVQKMIIEKANMTNKISIVATELLSTMENDNQPTRAEVSDVYNAVIDGSDAVLLSGETTIGNFPVETVDVMHKIILSAEEDINYIALLDQAMRSEEQDVTTSIAYSVVDSANRLRVKAILASTNSGYTAKKISRFRPMCPIIAPSPNLDTVRSLTLNFGIYPVLVHEYHSTDEIVQSCKQVAKQFVNVEPHDYIIITGGFPVNVNNTNFMKIEEM